MSHSPGTGISDAESESGGSENAESSLSRCSSSTSLVINTLESEKNLEGSPETSWTDSKHSSYLDFMEANFVQNMFARCYCMEDVCGKTAYHHHHQHDTHFLETDYNTAESRPHVRAVECDIFDWDERTWISAGKTKAPAGIPKKLLANPWFKHFQQRNARFVGLKTNNKMAQGDGQHPKTQFIVVNNLNLGHWHSASDTLSDSEKKPAVNSKTLHLKPTEMKACPLNASSNDSIDTAALRNKRRILWSTYKQVQKTRQKTDTEIEGGIRIHEVNPIQEELKEKSSR